jgi:type II secretion system protein I
MRTGREAGFTLLEVMVAMAVLGLAVATVLQLSSQNLRLLRLAGEHQAATLLADRLAREKDPQDEETDSGEEGAYRWERRVSAVSTPRELDPPTGRAPRLLAVRVAVRWGQGRAVEVATLRAVAPAPGREP